MRRIPKLFGGGLPALCVGVAFSAEMLCGFRGTHQLRHRIIAHGHIVEVPDKICAPVHHLIHKLRTAGGIKVLTGIAAGNAKGQALFLQQLHGLNDLPECAVSTPPVGCRILLPSIRYNGDYMPRWDPAKSPNCANLPKIFFSVNSFFSQKRSRPQTAPFFIYRRKPSRIFCSASSAVRPRVISLRICSPAIFPIAASWIRLAST